MSKHRRRVLCRTGLWAMVGFIVPSLIHLLFYHTKTAFNKVLPVYPWVPWERLTRFYLGPALVLTALFALAALASYLPRKGLQYGHSLIVVIATTLLPTYLMAHAGWNSMRTAGGYAETLRNCQITAVIAGIVGFMIALRMGIMRPGPIDLEKKN